MGGITSRKRDQQVVEDDLSRGISGRYCRSGSIKWSRPRNLRSKSNQCPSLLDLCINRIREVHAFCQLVCFDFFLFFFPSLLDSHVLSCNRIFKNTIPFLFFQETLASRSSMNWSILTA